MASPTLSVRMRSGNMNIEPIPGDPQLTLDFSLAISIPELIDTLTYYMGVQQDKSPPTTGAGAVQGAPATASSGAHSPAVPVAVAGVRVRTPGGTQTVPPPPPPPPPPASARDGPCAAALPSDLAPATTAGHVWHNTPAAPAGEGTQSVTWESPISDLQDLYEQYVLKTQWKKSDVPGVPPASRPWTVLSEEMRDCLSNLKSERMASPPRPEKKRVMMSSKEVTITGEAAQPTSARLRPAPAGLPAGPGRVIEVKAGGCPVAKVVPSSRTRRGRAPAAASGAHSPAGGHGAEPDGPPPGLPSPGGAAAAAGGPAAGPQPKAPDRRGKQTEGGKQECKHQ